MRKNLFTAIVLLVGSSSLFAQTPSFSCSFTTEQSVVEIEQANRIITKYTSERKKKTESMTQHVLPIVIHVVHLGEPIGVGSNISDEQIKSGIQQINDALANANNESVDIGVRFELAKKDPNCQSTTGIVRVDGRVLNEYETEGVRKESVHGTDNISLNKLSGWPFKDYFNVWLVTEIDNQDSTGTVGYATSPILNAPFDGVVVVHKHWGNQGSVFSWSSEGKVGTHEFGHAFGLYHTTEGDGDGTLCPAPNGCGTDIGDCCDDTSPHHKTEKICLMGDMNDCTEEIYDDVINNYMNPTVGTCNFKFTSDQQQRMIATLQTIRKGLMTSDGLETESRPFNSPIAAACTPQTDSLGLSDGYAGITLVSIKNTMEYASRYASVDKGYLDVTNDCKNYALLKQDSTYELSVSVWENTNTVKSWIDFNNNGTFENEELIFDKTIQSLGTDVSSFSIPQSAVTEHYLRMRVMNDLSAFDNACHIPKYGQAEDYSVFIQKGADPLDVVASFENKTMEVYPQPFENELTIQLNETGLTATTSYQIINMMGQVIQTGLLNANKELVVKTENIVRGTYVLVVQGGDNKWVKHIVK